MAIYEFEGKRPQISRTAFVYPEATIIGDVTIGEGCYVGPGARIRGDWGTIIIGPHSNIQENCVIHSAPGTVTQLGERSHIGHGAILHNPVLEDHVTVGMGAIIMQDVKIGAGSLIAAGAVVPARTVIPPKRIYAGVPARDIGAVSEADSQALDNGTAYYMALPERCQKGLRRLDVTDLKG